jgi:hypothetical protein
MDYQSGTAKSPEVTIKPQLLNGAPKLERPAQTPAQTAAPKPGDGSKTPPPAEGQQSETAAEMAKLKAAVEDLVRKEKKHVATVRKFSEEKSALAAKEKSLGEKLSRLDQLEKQARLMDLDLAGFLEAKYGKDWYDKATNARLGTASPVDVVTVATEKLKEEFQAELAKRDEAAKTAAAQAQEQQLQAARERLLSNVQAFLKDNAKDYPAFGRLGDEAAVSRFLASRIEQEYIKSGQGEPLSPKAAADLVEGELLALAEEIAAHSKYQEKLRAKLQPQAASKQQPQRNDTQQRRTLSNELSGRTQEEKPAGLSRQEKWERAKQAFNAVHFRAT